MRISCVKQVFLLAVLSAVVCHAQTTDLYVDQNTGNDSNDGLSWLSPLETIDAAVDIAEGMSGTKNIYVAEGTYSPVYSSYCEWTKFFGGYPAGGGVRDLYSNRTVIDGGGTTTCFTVGGYGVAIDGFVLTNGVGINRTVWMGQNVDFNGGGGIHAYYGSLAINNVIVTNCSASATEIDNNPAETPCGDMGLVTARHGVGGGIFCFNAGCTMKNVLIYGNTITDGGTPCDKAYGRGSGLYYYNDNGVGEEMKNLTVTANTNDVGTPGAAGAHLYTWDYIALRNSIIYGNEMVDLYKSPQTDNYNNNIGTGYINGTTDISVDPMWVNGSIQDSGFYLDPASLCVDAGSNTALFFGLNKVTTRTDHVPDSGTVDLGFHYPVPVDSYCVAEKIVSGTGLILSWGGGLPLFSVYRDTNPQMLTKTCIESCPTGEYTIVDNTPLDNGISYFYKIEGM